MKNWRVAPSHRKQVLPIISDELQFSFFAELEFFNVALLYIEIPTQVILRIEASFTTAIQRKISKYHLIYLRIDLCPFPN